MGEHFTMAHAVTFGLIWLGVIMFTLAGRQSRLVAPEVIPAVAPAAAAD
jgi:hypothetical protein